MSFEEAMQVASRDERFMATVYAMNSLLIDKGIYTKSEFEQLFVEWVAKEENKKQGKQRLVTTSGAASA